MDSNLIAGYFKVKRAIDSISCFSQNGWEVDLGDTVSDFANALTVLQSPFSCSGDSRGRYSQLNNLIIKVDGVDCGTVGNVNVEKLKSLASPSPFGRGAETVVDETVRKGLEIKADRIKIRSPHSSSNRWMPKLKGLFTHEVNSILCPTGREYEAKLHKLCLYEPGGFFDSHVDTMHDQTHHATALICLPHPHEGGVLEVQSGNTVKQLSFAPEQDEAGAPLLKWAAFYTDCTHRVGTVTSGTRVMLQYDLHAKEVTDYSECEIFDSYGRNRHPSPPDLNTAALAKLESLLHEWFAGNDPTRIAFLLRHRYHSSAAVPSMLKKVDALLYTSLLPTFNIHLTPIIIHHQGCDDGGEEDPPTIRAYPLDLRVNDSGSEDSEKDSEEDSEDEDDEMNFEPQVPNGSKSGPTPPETVLVPASKSARIELVKSQEYVEHTGNEVQVAEHMYYAVALVVEGVKGMGETAAR
ncbi:hypothetical protein HK104_006803 [Borealophlyctis nickersoniae]|nr:hypothetical protein HK104_006803 [Borealophlyctis nickersoniae]